MTKSKLNRRQFIKKSGSLAVGASVLGSLQPSVYARGGNTIRLALLGCGGRGTGAVGDALSVKGQGPVKLYATADLLSEKMERSITALKKKFPGKVDVTEDRKFRGFDGYKRADPGGLHRLLRADKVAKRKNLKVAAGLQCRHSPARQALIEKIRNGEMGDIPLIRANRLGGTRWMESQGDKSNILMEQLQFGRIHLYWIGSGHMVDNLIHQIDECCWIKDAWPVKVVGMGGREPNSTDHGQNIDLYSMEYTFADGTKAMCGFRRMKKARNEFATFIHGTKCSAQFSGRTHAATVHMFKDQRIEKSNISWTPTKDAFSPWQYEWNELIKSIREDRPHNEIRRAVYSDLTSLMGRAACHTGQEVTWEQIMNSRFQFCDYLDDLDYVSAAPVKADRNGQFPVPIAGKWTEI